MNISHANLKMTYTHEKDILSKIPIVLIKTSQLEAKKNTLKIPKKIKKNVTRSTGLIIKKKSKKQKRFSTRKTKK